MIKKITLKNIYGIREEMQLNFETKFIKDKQLQYENGIAVCNKVKTLLTPTLIAKNASGKTSVLKALKFANDINSIDDLTQLIFKEYFEAIDAVDRKLMSVVKRLVRYIDRRQFKDENDELSNEGKKRSVKYFMAETSRQTRYISDKIIFDDYLLREENNMEEYIYNQMEMLESGIANFLKKKLDDALNSFNKTNRIIKNDDFDQLKIEIEYTDGKSKKISIGKEISFNENTISWIDFLNQQREYVDNTDYMNHGYTAFNTLVMFIQGKDDISWKEVTIMAEQPFIRRITNKKVIEQKMVYIDDQSIRSYIDELSREKFTVLPGRRHLFEDDDNLLSELVDFYSMEFISELLVSIDPSISHVEKTKGDIIKIVDNNSENKNINTLSFGTLKIIYIFNKISKVFNSGENSFVLMDEIENGLNVSLIKLIITIFTDKDLNKNNVQLILTTHNPVLFDLGIISSYAAFINIDGKFKKPGDLENLINRTEDNKKLFMTKNYFNSYFWLKLSKQNELLSPDTIGANTIDSLFDIMEENINAKN